MAEDFEQGSPEWWLKRLGKGLDAQARTAEKFDRYYRGDHPIPTVPDKLKDAFHKVLFQSRSNFTRLVVDAVEERLSVTGFRFAEGDEADKDAWQMWQANGLDADSQMGHVEAIKTGAAYVLVEPRENLPLITVEHPTQVIVAHESGSRRRRAAALKRWHDHDGYVYANLYLPNRIYKFRSKKAFDGDLGAGQTVEWEPKPDEEEGPNPLGVVPVVPLLNRPDMMGRGESEIEEIVDTQDRINKLIFDLMVASEFSSFRQRWATGLEVPEDEDGNPVEPFKVAIDRAWVNENPDGRFGEFSQTDLTPLVRAIEMHVQHMATQSRTPPHYFYLRGEFPSGESIKSAETGLVAKARDKMLYLGEAWEDVIRLAFRARNDDRASAITAETIWADPESRSESEHIDALVKQLALGVPRQALWERAGWSPTEISRFESMRAREALLGLGVDLAAESEE